MGTVLLKQGLFVTFHGRITPTQLQGIVPFFLFPPSSIRFHLRMSSIFRLVSHGRPSFIPLSLPKRTNGWKWVHPWGKQLTLQPLCCCENVSISFSWTSSRALVSPLPLLSFFHLLPCWMSDGVSRGVGTRSKVSPYIIAYPFLLFPLATLVVRVRSSLSRSTTSFSFFGCFF